MISKAYRNSTQKSGMTLSEVIIAIGVIAFSIPLILGATGGAHRARQDAEADTRSAWLVRDAQRRIMDEWSESKAADSSELTMELNYKQDGTFIAEGVDQAVYLVTAAAEPYVTNENHSTALSLARITIKIQYPAKASPNNRKILTYQFVSNRDGIL